MSATLPNTLTFSDEQAMLLETATALFRQRSPIAKVRDLLLQESGHEAALWDEMVQLGWTALAIPERFGGSSLGMGAAVAIAEPMGRHLSATPWLSTQLFTAGVLAGGSAAQQQAELEAVAGGSPATVALFEEDGAWDLAAAGLKFVRHGAGIRLEGDKTLVLDAASADRALISGNLDGAPALAIVAAEALTEASPERETVIDETRRSYRLRCSGLEIADDQLITGGAAAVALDAIRDTALLLVSAESAGGTAAVLELIIDYLNTREAFGRRIGSYQALKHPTVNILIGLERSRSHVYHGASLIDAGAPATVALRMAKAESSAAFAFAGDRGIQFHGGMGFTWECDAQLYLRRALYNQYTFGDAPYHQRLLEDLLLTE